jgi:hypothetical protein
MKKEGLTIFTYSPTGIAPSWTPPVSTRSYSAICFVPYGIDESQENGWLKKPTSIVLSRVEDIHATNFIKILSLGHIDTINSVWIDFDKPQSIDPWSLIDSMPQGTVISAKRSDNKVYEEVAAMGTDNRSKNMSLIIQKEMTGLSIPNERSINTEMVARIAKPGLFKIEQSWIKINSSSLGKICGPSLHLGLAKTGSSDKFFSINE